MPQATDIVLLNGAASPVEKTFTLVSPAAGDNSYANWRLKEGAISTTFPRIAIATKANNNKARKANIKLQIPSSYKDEATGLTRIGSAFDMNVDVTVPDDFPEVLKADAVAYASNLMAHAIVQAVMRDAAPAT